MSVLSAHVSLTAQNTLGFESEAQWYAAPTSRDECRAALAEARARGLAITVLGGGSNVILDPFVPGVVLVPALMDQDQEEAGDGTVLVRAGAGLEWSRLVTDTAAQGLWGIENLALIPGRCGAAPVQNIGAYGVELADVLVSVKVIHFDGREEVIATERAALGYRDSIFKGALAGRCVITGITLALSRRAAPKLHYGDLASRVSWPCTPADVAAAVSAIRREKLPDPKVLGNVGSFFKNPVITRERADQLLAVHAEMPCHAVDDQNVKVPAAWLIDRCGFKGITRGSVGVHDRQALVLVNRGGGNAAALMALADDIVQCVDEHFGITLEPEPRRIGLNSRGFNC